MNSVSRPAIITQISFWELISMRNRSQKNQKEIRIVKELTKAIRHYYVIVICYERMQYSLRTVNLSAAI